MLFVQIKLKYNLVFQPKYLLVYFKSQAEILCDMTVETIDDAKKACKKLFELGSRIIIITMGEQGAVVSDKEGQYDHVEVEKSSKVCDSTGAGDSFVGTLALLMARKDNLTLKEQVKRACQVASQSVEKKGTQTSYPTKEELRFNLFE